MNGPEAVFALLGILVGGLFGWVAARQVDERAAKRATYATYLAAVEQVATGTNRYLTLTARGGTVEPMPEMPSGAAANAALSKLMVMGSGDMVALASRLQTVLNRLQGVAFMADAMKGDPREGEWKDVAAQFTQLRREFITRARRETGIPDLPDEVFLSEE